jgi:hypothetical protein
MTSSATPGRPSSTSGSHEGNATKPPRTGLASKPSAHGRFAGRSVSKPSGSCRPFLTGHARASGGSRPFQSTGVRPFGHGREGGTEAARAHPWVPTIRGRFRVCHDAPDHSKARTHDVEKAADHSKSPLSVSHTPPGSTALTLAHKQHNSFRVTDDEEQREILRPRSAPGEPTERYIGKNGIIWHKL